MGLFKYIRSFAEILGVRALFRNTLTSKDRGNSFSRARVSKTVPAAAVVVSVRPARSAVRPDYCSIFIFFPPRGSPRFIRSNSV